MTLDVIVPTFKPDGIQRVAKLVLPPQKGVNYIVSWQKHENSPIPSVLLREDVKIYRNEGVGSSPNRNNAISHSNADIVYLADDDITLMPDALKNIIKRFEEYPQTDMATFKMLEEDRKKYPEEVTKLGFYLPKNYNVGTYQMAFRRNIFPLIKFNEKFGINAPLFEAGEDELFHLEFRKKGYNCYFFPDIIASHPHEATGSRRLKNPKVVYGMGAVITKSFPKSFLARIPVKAYRMHKKGQYNFFAAIRDLAIGAFKSFSIKV